MLVIEFQLIEFEGNTKMSVTAPIPPPKDLRLRYDSFAETESRNFMSLSFFFIDSAISIAIIIN